MSLYHTVMPLELVFGANPAVAGIPAVEEGVAGHLLAAGGQLAAGVTVSLGQGRAVELEPGPMGMTVRRLYSSNPHDYLDPRFQPGTPYQG